MNNTNEQETIVLQRELAISILGHLLDFADEGTAGRGWKSDQLIADTKTLFVLIENSKHKSKEER